jgi:hypothetical protein
MRKSILFAAIAIGVSVIPAYASSSRNHEEDQNWSPFKEVERLPAAWADAYRNTYRKSTIAPPPADAYQRVPIVPLQGDTYRISTGYEQVKAYCELYADSSNRGYFALGSIGFVAGAAIGNAISNAIEHAHAYEMCMVMKGYARQSP